MSLPDSKGFAVTSATVHVPISSAEILESNLSWLNATTLPDSEDPFTVDDGLHLLNAFTGLLFIILTVISNSLVIMIIIWGKQLRHRCLGDWLLLSLAVVNEITISFIGIVAETKYLSGVYPGRWDMCRAHAVAIIASAISNTLTVSMLSVERALAIAWPFFYTRNVGQNRKCAVLVVTFIWVFTFIVSTAPLIYGGKLKLTFSFCQPAWSDSSNSAYAKFVLVVSAFLLLVMLVFNLITIRTAVRLRQTMRVRMSSARQHSSSLLTDELSSNVGVGQAPERQRRHDGESTNDSLSQRISRRGSRRLSLRRPSVKSQSHSTWTASGEMPMTRVALVVTFLFGAVSIPHLVSNLAFF